MEIASTADILWTSIQEDLQVNPSFLPSCECHLIYFSPIDTANGENAGELHYFVFRSWFILSIFSALPQRLFFLSSNLTLGNKEWIVVWTIIRLKELEWRVHLSRKSTRRCSSTRTSWPHLCCPRDSLRWEQTCPKLLWFTAVECAWFLLTKLTAFTASCATRRTLRATSVIPAPKPCASVASRWLFGTACLRTPLMCPLSTSAPIVAPRSPASLRCPSSRSKWWILKWASFVFSWVNYSSSRFTFSLLVGLIDV